jgi:hypothetical protein
MLFQEQTTTVESDQRKGFEKSVSPGAKSSGGSESPKPGRKRFGSTADEIDVTKLNGMLVSIFILFLIFCNNFLWVEICFLM